MCLQKRCRTTLLMTSLMWGFGVGAQDSATTQFQSGQDNGRGFSYFVGLGRQSTTYTEDSSLGVHSSSSSKSALLITGALYAIHSDFLVALDNVSSFAPANTNENWTATGSTLPYETAPGVYEPRAVIGPLLQVNRFNLAQNNTRLLAHYRLAGPWFALGGINFHTQSFKRFNYDVKQPEFIDTRYVNAKTVVEETSSEVLAELGTAWESERVKGSPNHYSLKATIGLPVWRRLENTGAPDVVFDGVKGWGVNVEGRYSVAVHSIAHVGVWAQYSFAERGRQSFGALELPKAHTISRSIGMELLWKL